MGYEPANIIDIPSDDNLSKTSYCTEVVDLKISNVAHLVVAKLLQTLLFLVIVLNLGGSIEGGSEPLSLQSGGNTSKGRGRYWVSRGVSG